MIDYLPLVLTGMGIIVSILYYTSVLRNANKQNEKEFLNQKINLADADFYNNWRMIQRSEWTTYTEWREYRSKNPEFYGHFVHLLNVLNTVGLLHKKNAMDSELLFNVYTPNMILWTWEKAYPVIEVWRKTINYPEQYAPFEYLYNEVKKRYPNMRGRNEFAQSHLELTGENV